MQTNEETRETENRDRKRRVQCKSTTLGCVLDETLNRVTRKYINTIGDTIYCFPLPRCRGERNEGRE